LLSGWRFRQHAEIDNRPALGQPQVVLGLAATAREP
jgi:hypothetical protein